MKKFNLEGVKEFQPLDNKTIGRRCVCDEDLIKTLNKNEIMEQEQFGLWYFRSPLWQQLIYTLEESFTQRGYVLEVLTWIIGYALEILGFTHLLVIAEELQFASRKIAKWGVMSFGEKKIESNRLALFYKTCKCITAGRPA
ncbi:hypothetical protein [Ulvibacterium sp.]|uniref:hypothetical protein n=1 Tax=Ulvibacterium sp. TaxID=2665914 RepID=UPI003BAB35A1